MATETQPGKGWLMSIGSAAENTVKVKVLIWNAMLVIAISM